MKIKKWILAAAAVVLTSGLLAGCSSNGSQPGTAAAASVGGSTAQADAAETGNTGTDNTEAGSSQGESDGGIYLHRFRKRVSLQSEQREPIPPTATMMKAENW